MINDEHARQRIRMSVDESLIVEAAAGTGKTSELVQRIVNVIRTGRTTVDRIVAVTFTRKAAGELRLRLRAELDNARVSSQQHNEEVHRLEDALSRLEEAHIGTIHAFCAELLRQRPVEANIPPGFEELDEHQSTRLYNRAFDTWIQTALQEMPAGLRRALARLAVNTRSETEASPLHRLRWDARQLVEWRDFPAEWRRADFDRDGAIDRLLPEIVELSQSVSSCTDIRNPLRRHLQSILDFVGRLRRAEEMCHRDYDDLEALLVRLIRDLRRYHTKGPKKFSAQISRDELIEAKDRLLSNLDEFERKAGADLATLLQSDLRGLVDTYESLKNRAGKLDFVDLLIRTRNLLRDNPDVRHFMQRRFTHIFVDEFQDTDPLQAEILMLLSSDDPDQTDWKEIHPTAGKLFMVGDPKQSIYRFRRADVIMYQELCRRLQSKGVGMEYLTCSFRAVRPIQECVNAAFAPEMMGDTATGQPSYVPLEQFAPATHQPSLIALPAPFPYGVQRISNDAIERCLPAATAGFVDWLINESGWTVRDPLGSGQRIPIASQHIAILFRRFMSFGDDVTRGYVRALEVRNIPHVLWGARSFHQREEVETLRAALNAIEWLDDELSVYATLRGSLFAIPDSLLLRYFRGSRGRSGSGSPSGGNSDGITGSGNGSGGSSPPKLGGVPRSGGVVPTGDPAFEPIESALTLIRDLHRRRNWRSTVETINELLEKTRAHAGFALRPSGSQVLANIYRVCDLARGYEVSGGYSFRGFVEHLNAQAESEDSAEAPVLEEAAEGVRVMTVHAAKGLEFPVVILADITANIAQRSPDKHVDGNRRLCASRILNCLPWDLLDHEAEEHARDEAEGVRVAYVAATRARDLLVVGAIGDEQRDGWLKPLNKAIYPARQNSRSARIAVACPAFGPTTVMRRPVEFDGTTDMSVQPGLHTPEQGDHEVVWWDPALLRLDVEPSFGLRHQDILIEDPADRAAASVAQYESWKTERDQALTAGARASLEVFIATDSIEPPPGYADAVRITRVSRSGIRPHGPRFGSLVHQILRDVDYDSSAETIERLARTHARLADAPEDEIVAGIHAVAGCLKHPLFDLVRKSSTVYREYPLVVKTEGGALLDSVIDLAFKDASGWIVVDFKTDAEDPGRATKYRRQVGWYTYGLDMITGQRTTGWLLHL